MLMEREREVKKIEKEVIRRWLRTKGVERDYGGCVERERRTEQKSE